MKKIKKVLIANRGEIVSRIIATCRKMGIASVAVYTETDAELPYVGEADEKYLLKGNSIAETYLSIDTIISIAKNCGADAIHPGYGFLSENPIFAYKIQEANLIFIGPSSQSMEWMGNKISAKKLALAADVPLVPGDASTIIDHQHAKRVATEIGYPVLIKAAAGGGGKGMRMAKDETELLHFIDLVRSEAENAFGNGEIFIEKFIENPKHIEVQIFGDRHGNIVHIFERDCSIQRRHQKIIEEAPALILSDETKSKLYQSAIELARKCEYYSSGTVEFLVDKYQNCYFLEMNTRLQVEHPVTEMITGIDLVEWQIKVAEEQPLPLSQNEITSSGHAIQLRIYAEDYTEGFTPSPGKITHFEVPISPEVRLDSGFKSGNTVSLYYDPMIAKLIVWGENREKAIVKMQQTIASSRIEGIMTTMAFGDYVMTEEQFVSGEYTIEYITTVSMDSLIAKEKELGEIAALFCQQYLIDHKRRAFLG